MFLVELWKESWGRRQWEKGEEGLYIWLIYWSVGRSWGEEKAKDTRIEQAQEIGVGGKDEVRKVGNVRQEKRNIS